MSNGLVRPHITTGCAFATAGIMVCGFVAPSIEASGVRPEVRLVQLAALTGPVASPLGALVGTLPTTAEKLMSPPRSRPPRTRRRPWRPSKWRQLGPWAGRFGIR